MFMSNDTLERCPQCNEGFLRPTGRVGTMEDSTSTSDTRGYKCDKCGFNKTDVGISESSNFKDDVESKK
jgi:hypothetical protein